MRVYSAVWIHGLGIGILINNKCDMVSLITFNLAECSVQNTFIRVSQFIAVLKKFIITVIQLVLDTMSS